MKEFLIDIAVFILGVSLAVAVMLIFTGCATKTVYVDRIVEVKVPVKCVAPKVVEAKKQSNHVVTLADIIRERDELRESVKACQ